MELDDDDDDELDLDPIGAAYDRHAISVHPNRRAGEVVRNSHMNQVKNGTPLFVNEIIIFVCNTETKIHCDISILGYIVSSTWWLKQFSNPPSTSGTSEAYWSIS